MNHKNGNSSSSNCPNKQMKLIINEQRNVRSMFYFARGRRTTECANAKSTVSSFVGEVEWMCASASVSLEHNRNWRNNYSRRLISTCFGSIEYTHWLLSLLLLTCLKRNSYANRCDATNANYYVLHFCRDDCFLPRRCYACVRVCSGNCRKNNFLRARKKGEEKNILLDKVR